MSSEQSTDAVAVLVAALNANDDVRVTLALRRHPELIARINEPLAGLPFGATALLAAANRGSRRMVDALLAVGADVNQKSHWWAGGFGVLDGSADLVPHLISRGAIVDAYAASKLGMLDRLQALVAADPKAVETRGGDGQTPLHVAASVEVATFLVDHGAALDALDVDHESTPAQYAIGERQDVARFLVSRGAKTDILMAAALGDIALVRRLLDADPGCVRTNVSKAYFPMRDPRAGGTIYTWTLGRYQTAHLVAHKFGHMDVVGLLMERSPEGLRLAVACDIGNNILTSTLASGPARTPSLSPDEKARLSYAADRNDTPAVLRFLTAGFPVDARGDLGGTALHFAAWHGNVVAARAILEHKPPLEMTDTEHGGTPLGWLLHGSLHSWSCTTGDYLATLDALLAAGAVAPEITPKLEASAAVLEALRSRAAAR